MSGASLSPLASVLALHPQPQVTQACAQNLALARSLLCLGLHSNLGLQRAIVSHADAEPGMVDPDPLLVFFPTAVTCTAVALVFDT